MVVESSSAHLSHDAAVKASCKRPQQQYTCGWSVYGWPCEAQGPSVPTHLGQVPLERGVAELGDDVHGGVDRADAIERQDVGVAQGVQQLGLAHQPVVLLEVHLLMIHTRTRLSGRPTQRPRSDGRPPWAPSPVHQVTWRPPPCHPAGPGKPAPTRRSLRQGRGGGEGPLVWLCVECVRACVPNGLVSSARSLGSTSRFGATASSALPHAAQAPHHVSYMCAQCGCSHSLLERRGQLILGRAGPCGRLRQHALQLQPRPPRATTPVILSQPHPQRFGSSKRLHFRPWHDTHRWDGAGAAGPPQQRPEQKRQHAWPGMHPREAPMSTHPLETPESPRIDSPPPTPSPMARARFLTDASLLPAAAKVGAGVGEGVVPLTRGRLGVWVGAEVGAAVGACRHQQ
jgi:hypothetical protein